MPTPKQEKLIKLVLENLGSKGVTKTLGELIREAGYEESMAKNPYQIFESETIKEGLSEVVSELEKKRKMALNALTKDKIEDEKAKDLADIVDKLTKNIQLLSGGETERTKHIIDKINYVTPDGSNNNKTDVKTT